MEKMVNDLIVVHKMGYIVITFSDSFICITSVQSSEHFIVRFPMREKKLYNPVQL